MVRKRIIWIDLVRGLGMLLIIWGHSLNNPQDFLGTVIFEVNVPIFFVLSGFLYRPKKIINQVKKTIYNLFLPYLFTCFVMLINSIIVNKTGNTNILKSMGSFFTVIKAAFWAMGTPSVLIGTKLLMPSIGAIWFLIALFWDDLIFNYLIKNIIAIRYSYVFLTIVFSLFSYFGFYLARYGLLPWSLNASMIGLIFMWLGFLIKRIELLNIDLKKQIILIFITLAIWISAGFLKVHFWMNIAFSNYHFISIISAGAGSICIIFLVYDFDKWFKNKQILHIFSLYGRYSLVVLCVHIIDGNTLNVLQYNNISKPVWLVTLLNVTYHVLITLIGIFITRRCFLLKNVYYNREFPFIWQKNF